MELRHNVAASSAVLHGVPTLTVVSVLVLTLTVITPVGALGVVWMLAWALAEELEPFTTTGEGFAADLIDSVEEALTAVTAYQYEPLASAVSV